ncbi:MAG: hypothetical protein BECKG1743D_GA0114223_103733 [Candidatus Kentron sp. G]|nr:MAG: hypothetical protein BECKG1743F_GA0114225_103514 [Candidatus Kentron sp. G]VFN00734.1 MAG: hypothetical protein BECKG1743E_GA0114224_103473 [Candidatus Kentron sp. G]VFN02520.1 MAG: hypothetical protein BECKG1743D_GA0114223_103733 [Candidatus Kentron sp. G]
MILPTKHLSYDRALLTVGGRLLSLLTQPKTVSALWEEISRQNSSGNGRKPALRYDAYVLALDLLFMMGAIELQDGLLHRNRP